MRDTVDFSISPMILYVKYEQSLSFLLLVVHVKDVSSDEKNNGKLIP